MVIPTANSANSAFFMSFIDGGSYFGSESRIDYFDLLITFRLLRRNPIQVLDLFVYSDMKPHCSKILDSLFDTYGFKPPLAKHLNGLDRKNTVRTPAVCYDFLIAR